MLDRIDEKFKEQKETFDEKFKEQKEDFKNISDKLVENLGNNRTDINKNIVNIAKLEQSADYLKEYLNRIENKIQENK